MKMIGSAFSVALNSYDTSLEGKIKYMAVTQARSINFDIN